MSASGLPPLLIALGLVLVAVGFQAWRHPVERRLAVRDVVRRRGETVLVIAGSLLGTALITGSFIVGDTLDSSIRAGAFTQLGPIDETITVSSEEMAEEVTGEIQALDAPIDGVAVILPVPAAFAAEPAGETTAEPDGTLIEADLSSLAGFGGDPEATGLIGETPAPGTAAIGADLAAALEVGPGDTIEAFAYGGAISLEVDRILPQLGVAGFHQGFESSSPNAFVAPGTVESLAGGSIPEGTAPPRPVVLVSNDGGVIEGAERTDAVTAAIDRLDLDQVRVEPAKQDLLRAAEEQGDQFSQLFVSIGSFAIVAGILLLVNIFVMLSEERKNQLGMLRAVGMRRSDLIRTFAIEGGIYSIFAGLLGALLGIGVGWAIAQVAGRIFASAGDFALDLRFSMSVASMVGGFCIGALISLVTVFFTSVRISRINIIRAIRDLPEPKIKKIRKRAIAGGIVLTAMGAGLFVPALSDERAWAGAIVGPPMIVWGLVPAIGLIADKHKLSIIAAAFTLVWGIFGNTILGGNFFEAGDLTAFVLQGVMLTFAAVILLTQVQEVLEDLIRRVAARSLALRLGLAYPLARRFRTGLTLGMFALVMFTMIFIASMSSIFGGQVETTAAKTGGGFDVLATANSANPPDPSAVVRHEGVDEVAVATSALPLYALPPEDPDGVSAADFDLWPAVGVDRDFVEAGPPPLQEELAPGLDDDADAWARLLEDPSTVIIDDFFLQTGGGPPESNVDPGDTIAVRDPVTGHSETRVVLGVVEQDAAFAGSFMSRDSLSSVVGDAAAADRFYISLSEGASGTEVARSLQGAFVANGVEADTFLALVEEQNTLSLQFLRLMQGYLALGLLVGIAGLGVVMVRAVRERRRQIGVLRSLGFLPSQVRRAFLLEAGFVAIEGIVVGAVLALVTASQLVANGDFGEGLVFSIPWAQVLFLCGSAAVASLLATAWPARRAAQIPPAVALRVAD